MDVTYHASRSYSSVMRLGSSTLALLAVSIKGVTGSEGVFGINCFLKNSTSQLKICFCNLIIVIIIIVMMRIIITTIIGTTKP